MTHIPDCQLQIRVTEKMLIKSLKNLLSDVNQRMYCALVLWIPSHNCRIESVRNLKTAFQLDLCEAINVMANDTFWFTVSFLKMVQVSKDIWQPLATSKC